MLTSESDTWIITIKQRGSNFDIFLVDEEREEPNTAIIDPPAKRHLNDGLTLNSGWVALLRNPKFL